MQRLLFIYFLLIPFNSYCQNQDSTVLKNWFFYLEYLGNGGYYSINGEFNKHNENLHWGDRFGLSYSDNIETTAIDNWYISIVYEKNFTIGKKLIRPEIGLGGSLFFFKYNTRWFSYKNSEKEYRLNSNKIVCWLVPRLGIRIVGKSFWFLRFGYTPAVFLTELNEEDATKFDSRFGAAFGINLNDL